MLENFRPGTLEKWGLGYEELKKENPKLILARISGYGQTGPNAQKPGFAAVAEAFGGLRYVTGEPDRPPVRPNLSLGDSVAGLHAALGIMMALYHRDAKGGEGQVIDVALYETVLNLMEGTISEFDLAGVKREREGMRLDGNRAERNVSVRRWRVHRDRSEWRQYFSPPDDARLAATIWRTIHGSHRTMGGRGMWTKLTQRFPIGRGDHGAGRRFDCWKRRKCRPVRFIRRRKC